MSPVPSDTTCDATTPQLAEYAAGLLAGDERALVARHLESCAPCREEAERFASVLDALVELAPVAEPPASFEDGLWQRIGATPGAFRALAPGAATRSPLRLRRRSFVVAAAVAVSGLAFGVGLAVGGGTHGAGTGRDVGRSSASAPFASRGRRLGTVSVLAGPPAWLYVALTSPTGYTGLVTCTVTLADGRRVALGRFRLVDGRGTWGVALGVTGRVAGARLVAADGSLVASARLPA